MINKSFVEHEGKLVAEVRFHLPDSLWADMIYLVGDFNGWNRSSHPMQRAHDGKWFLTLTLEVGHAYQFRYLRNQNDWLNDTEADAYMHNLYQTCNFVVVTDPAFKPYSDLADGKN